MRDGLPIGIVSGHASQPPHAEKRADLKKWLGVCKNRQEKLVALKIFRSRNRPRHVVTVQMNAASFFKQLGQPSDWLRGIEGDD